MGQGFIWIVLFIVVINIIGGLMQAAAKKREEQRRISELRKAAPRTAAEPQTRATAATATASRPNESTDIWAEQRGQTTSPTSPSAQQVELERRRQAQLEELRRRRAAIATGGVVIPGSSTPPPAPPAAGPMTRTPQTSVQPSQQRPAAVRPDVSREARTESRPAARSSAPAVSEAMRRRDEPRAARQARQAPPAPTRREVAIGHVTPLDAQGRAAAKQRRDMAVVLPDLRSEAGLARLREAVILKEIFDRPLALRQDG